VGQPATGSGMAPKRAKNTAISLRHTNAERNGYVIHSYPHYLSEILKGTPANRNGCEMFIRRFDIGRSRQIARTETDGERQQYDKR
jgi:hypothetical protein